MQTKLIDVTNIFKNTKSKMIKKALSSGKGIYAFKLPRFKGLLGYELVPGRRIGTELADIAKRFGLGGILHSDELPNYGISETELKELKKILEVNENDGYIILIGEEGIVKIVTQEIVKRINEMLIKIPKDTRQAKLDGTTSFLRPQPGSARMYPETDHPLIYVDRNIRDYGDYEVIEYILSYGDIKERLKLIRLKNSEKYFEIREKYPKVIIINELDPEFRKSILKKYGLNEKIIEDLIWSEKLPLFEMFASNYKNVKPTIIYYLLFSLKTDLKKEGVDSEPSREILEEILNLLNKDKITKEAIPKIVARAIKEDKKVVEVVNELGLWKLNKEEAKKRILEFLNENKQTDRKKLIGEIFRKFRYVVDGKVISEILNELNLK